jgi:exosortase K
MSAEPSRPVASTPAKPRAFSPSALDLTLVLAVLFADYVAKSFASHAGARELDCLLAPTAALVGALTGHAFVAESGTGYIARELHVVIAPVCSGMNFAIIAFTALTCAFVARIPDTVKKLAWVLMCAPLAYMATVVANTLRIVLGLTAGRTLAAAGLLSAEDAHRAVGVAVYLGALLALHALASAACGRRAGSAVVPLACYVGLTVLAPLVRGAARDPAFFAHGALVLGTAGTLAVVVWHLARSAPRPTGAKASFERHDRDAEDSIRARHGTAQADTVVDPFPPRVDVAQRRHQRALPGQGDAALVFGTVR